MITPTRRGFLGLMASALAAPVIVKASSLMAVKPVYNWGEPILFGFSGGHSEAALERVLIEIRRNRLERRLAIADSPQLLVIPPGLQMQARRIIES